jgi:hypothetical protein
MNAIPTTLAIATLRSSSGAVTLRSSFILLAAAAVWLSVYYRRLFLLERGPVGLMRFLAALVCVALLAFGSWALFHAISISPDSVRTAIYMFLPLIVGAMYLYQIFTFKDLPKQWKRSPLFIIAILPPILGCILMSLIWWHDLGRHRAVAVPQGGTRRLTNLPW